jgi:hypothetical protein
MWETAGFAPVGHSGQGSDLRAAGTRAHTVHSAPACVVCLADLAMKPGEMVYGGSRNV